MLPNWRENITYTAARLRPYTTGDIQADPALVTMRRGCDKYNLEKKRGQVKMDRDHLKEAEEEAKVDAVLMNNWFTRDMDYRRETNARCRAVAQHQLNEAKEKRRNRGRTATPDYHPISSYSGVKGGIVPWDGLLGSVSPEERRDLQRRYRAQLDNQIVNKPKPTFSKEEDMRKTVGTGLTWETSYHQWEDNKAMKQTIGKWYKDASFSADFKEDCNIKRELPGRPQTAADARNDPSTMNGWFLPKRPISLRQNHGRKKWSSEIAACCGVGNPR